MINVVVGNLPPGITCLELEQFFASYGTVKGVRLGRDYLTGRRQSFCYLDLQEAQGSARAPFDLEGARLSGHRLNVGAAASPSGWAIGAD